MNLGQIRAELRRLIRDTSEDTSLQRYSDGVLLTRINNTQEEMSAFTQMLESQVDVNITAGTAEYAFTSIIMAVKKAYWKNGAGVYVPLNKKTTTELDLTNPDWRDESGDPNSYYIRDNFVGLYPNPQTSLTAGLRLEIVNRPVDLAADGDIPFNSEYQFYFAHQGIAFGAGRLCLMDEGKWNEATALESRYSNVIREIQKQMSSENTDTRIPNVYEINRSVRRSR